MKNYAIKVLEKKRKKAIRLFLFSQTSLTKCIEDQKFFKAAKENIPFYKAMVTKYQKRREQIDAAIKKLKQ